MAKKSASYSGPAADNDGRDDVDGTAPATSFNSYGPHAGQSFGMPAADFTYPSWLPNQTPTNSFFPSYDPDEEDDEPSSRTDELAAQASLTAQANLTAQADVFDKQALELKAAMIRMEEEARTRRSMAAHLQGTDGPPALPPPALSEVAEVNPYAFYSPMGPMVGVPGIGGYGMPGMGMPLGMPGMYGQMPGGMMPFPQEMSSKAAGSSSHGQTTVMWRNIPNNFTRDDLLQLIDSSGFQGTYDFFYSPVDFTSNALVGYAFINFVSTQEANAFYEYFQNFTQWTLKSEKVSEVTWSKPLQGLEGHIERYRNSPVMHPDVSEDRRPLLFKDGKIIPFPKPTKKIRAPHLKECRPGKG